MQTKQEKYGDPYWNNNEQAIKTKFNKFGAGQPLDYKQKREATLLKEQGNPHWNNSEKRQQTCLENYGVPSYSKTEEFLENAINCYRSKYGLSVSLDNYIIVFVPSLYVIELFN